MKTHRLLAHLAGVVVACAPCAAANVTLELTGLGRRTTNLTLVDGGTTFHNVTAGELKWRVTASDFTPTIKPGSDIKTFCADLYQFVSHGTLQVAFVAEAPSPGPSMGWFRATLISKLYAAHHADSDDSDVNAAAFQVAIYEIIYEAAFTNATSGSRLAAGINAAAGDFRLTNNAAVQTLANTYLDGAFASSTRTPLMSLVAPGVREGQARFADSDNPNIQDQIYFAPAPPAVGLAGVGLVGLGTRRTRRR